MSNKDRNGIDPRRHSRVVVDGPPKAPARAMLRAVGFKDEDFAKPQVGIASTWSMVTPCNMHIDVLAREAGAGADAAGAQERAVQHDYRLRRHLERHAGHALLARVPRGDRGLDRDGRRRREGFDGFVAIGGCDKNMPGCAMAMARLDRPSVFVYGGTIQPGPKSRDIISVFEAVGSHAAGKISDAELRDVESTAIPGPGLVRRHVHGEHHGVGDRSPRSEPPEQLGPRSRVVRRRATIAGARAKQSSR